MNAPYSPKTISVLLLDDSEVMLELVYEILRDLGITDIATAGDGERGLAVFDAAERKPDVVICDLGMPGMDGIEFLRHIAARGYEGDVMLSSAADSAVLKAAERLAREHGLSFLGLLEKPVTEQALAAALARSGGRRTPRAAVGSEQTLTPDEVRAGIASGCVDVFFQPKVSLHERRVLGVECLARWRHAERGLLSPAAFIGVVEQHGMIDDFTLAMFRKAVAQQRAWRDQGHAIRINVNVSMDNLLRLDLPEILDGIVREAGLEPGDMVLEMTESRLMHNLRISLDILIRLRLKGFGLSIDDFGTGYSTMESLQQLPFSELKIDRAFVNGAAEDPAARAILVSSIGLGRTFGLNVVAEGVETQGDWDLVAVAGCDEVQGFFVARPMPAEELIGWKQGWEAAVVGEREEDMSEKPLILTVEDDSAMRDLIAAALDDNYRTAGSASGEEALRAARALLPQAILLDVEMPPGIDGYETCRRLKDDEATADIPVVFVSAHDSVENRLQGYEAGGDDYIVKPFDAFELEAKLTHLLKSVAERAGLKQMANYASTTAMTAMTSMSEMGALLQVMKSFGACNDYRELADTALAGIAPYGLSGAVQVRSSEGMLTRNAGGEASPLEASVISQMAGMDRITQFKSRMSISYHHVSLLVHDMPVEDPDRCGRLRDHLAMLVEAADARAEAIAAAIESRRRGATIEHAVTRITAALADIDRAQRQNQVATRIAVESVTQRMETAYISVALSPSQEDFMAGILRDGLDNLLSTQTGVFGLQNQLSSIVQELKAMAAPIGAR